MGKQAPLTVPTPTTTPLTQTGPNELFGKDEDNWEPSQLLSKDLSRTPPKSRKVSKKPKVTRVFNPDDRFLAPHIERYYLFPFHYSCEHPYFRISWKNWKPNGIYKKMAGFLSNLSPDLPNKTPNQCKSYDERMKYLHFDQARQHPQDLLDASLKYFQQSGVDSTSRECITRYVDSMQTKSRYVDFLERERSARGEVAEEEVVARREVKMEEVSDRQEFEVYFADSGMGHNEFFDE